MESRPRWRQLLDELKRRHVYRVAATYAVVGYGAVQVADLTFVRLGLPPWTVTFLIVLVALGFPVALVLAWAFELTPDGVRRTSPATGEVSGSAEGRTDRRLTRGNVLVLVAVLLLVPVGGWWLQGGGGAGGPAVDRLAVLPLANLMNDPAQEHFVQGMHDELISELQQAGVAVIARTSVLRYADGETPAREIARELGVDALVEGTVYRAGDSVEIDARIVDPATEEYIWSASFAESVRNVESLHRGLTGAIARAIHAALDPEDEARLRRASPVEPQAYDAYLKGVMHSQRFTPSDLATALGYFERALEIDSTFAPAHLGIARVWLFRAQAGYVSAAEAQAHADPAVERARQLGGSLGGQPMAVTGAGVTTWADWEFEEAEEAFREAIELNDQHPETRIFYGHLLTMLGRWDEAEDQVEKAVAMDPLNPFIQGLYGTQRHFVRRHGEAIRVLEDLFETHPGAGFGRSALAAAYRATGRSGEALRMYREMAEARGDPDVRVALERGARAGGLAEALARAADTLAVRPEGEYAPPFRIAVYYAAAGEETKALAWLERAFEARDQNIPYLGVLPILEDLHDRPAFRALARRVGVPVLDEEGEAKFPPPD